MQGYLRKDGKKGIRNIVVVVYLVECAHHVSAEIARPFSSFDVHVIGFQGCYPNQYSLNMLQSLCTHPNVYSVLLVSLGCEGFNNKVLKETILASGRRVDLLVIQKTGGSLKTIALGEKWVKDRLAELHNFPSVPINLNELVIGTICGGSDGTSGLTANPAIGKTFDSLVKEGAICIFEETGELIGCKEHLAQRATTPELRKVLLDSIEKAEKYYKVLGHGSFAPGNAEGGLTTQEEKSLGAYTKSGTSQISGLIKPGDKPKYGGLYLLDVVPDGEVRFGFPNINDNAEIAELIACGSHMILFTTGRGSVVGSALSPVIKVCANPETFINMEDDMDINAGKILTDEATLDSVGQEIINKIKETANGERTKSEKIGHREFVLTYKSFEPIGPTCLPVI